ncbi:pantothenate transporter liz1 [Glonium stellatum]|uniref:Pantothenate transporter liz1 n=1 Tax=Glonium stellatum TaxID=574774 RepID=A0A8E2ERC4_9PEZI|nr:pantothenate transporter liz1 [Glonium stellatum]
MASSHAHSPSEPRYSLPGDDKLVAEHLSDHDAAAPIATPGHAPGTKLVPPPLVREMSAEQRAEAEARLRRKIDTRLLPMIIFMYIMNYLDRNNIAAVRLAGLQDELNLASWQYQTTVSILFVGYILMQIPSNLFLNKIGLPAVYLPSCMIVWGIISGATAGCQTFGGLLAIRFFLGFVEAAYFPGCLFYLSAWYTRKELGLRTAILYSGSLVSGAFGGLITAGITENMDGARGLRAWRWVFIIEGAITVVVAFTSFFILPNFPRTTKWLTEEERQLAVWRLQEDIGEDDWVNSEEQSFFHGMKLAFLDIKTWILMVMLLGIVSSASVTNFFPTVVKTLGYNNVKTLLLTAPPYVLAVITTFLNAWHADRTGERYLHVVLPLCVGVAAFILAAATTGTAPRYVAMMLMVPGVYTGYVVTLAWISNSIPRPPAKRAAALAAINAVSNASSIYASYMYPQQKGVTHPNLVTPLAVDSATAVLAIIMATILRLVLARLNKKLDRGEHVEGAINAVPEEASEHGFRFLL